MTIAHHPSEAVLTAYAAGGLADGPSLLVEVHLEGCVQCRREVRLLEHVGGALLDELPPAAMAGSAFAQTLARLDDRPEETHEAQPALRFGGLVLPAALVGRLGVRWPLGPGLWLAAVRPGTRGGWITILVRTPAGLGFVRHGHGGTEFLAVLGGAISDEFGSYGPGDFVEWGQEREHRPRVEAGPCFSLLAISGGLTVRGLAGLVLPLVGLGAR